MRFTFNEVSEAEKKQNNSKDDLLIVKVELIFKVISGCVTGGLIRRILFSLAIIWLLIFGCFIFNKLNKMSFFQ